MGSTVATRAGSRGSVHRSAIRIVVADDQSMDRGALIALLKTQPDFVIVGEAANGQEAASRCKRLRPDVVIMSLQIPTLNGASAISTVCAAYPPARVIALAERGVGYCQVLNPPRKSRLGLQMSQQTSGTQTDCLQIAVSEGALGALRRDTEPEQLFRAVRAVAQGNAWYEPGTASAISTRARGAGSTNGARPLSSRELDVAGLIADGHSNKEIGRALGISEPTVKKHVGHVLVKLGLQDRLQIGIYIVRNPLLFQDRRER